MLPPPNVTGILHIGHSLGGTCQDILARFWRMQGFPTLWVPGVDHAGLATQLAVRQALQNRGVDASSLSPEELRREIDGWRREKEEYIRTQLTRHGFSLDWSRYVYTMSPGYSRAVTTAFLDLYHRGLVYRAERMVHWDPKALTALSDLEVIPTETQGKLWYILYPSPSPDTPSRGIVVATTRPETLFGDVAVAVHPSDERYRGLPGSRVRLPLTDREIPVIADDAVDPSFGNGALKVTPSHDPVDHAIARRHPELPSRRDVLDERAHLSGEWVPAPFQGLERFAARRAVVAALRESGLLVKEEPHTHNVGYSERSEVPVEPRLSLQWWVDTREMGRQALQVVRSGEVEIRPDRWLNTYYHFFEDLQDWCISRQVVWGHPIPVWYCDACGRSDAADPIPDRCPGCGAAPLRRETDVLDTWFSSWLWPFAVLGWPQKTPDLEGYFPVDTLVTGSDILFFWVGRMIMASEHFLGKAPFRRVYLTGILRDAQNRKFSKHLGNSPDPLELIRLHGADAFRFGLVFPNPTDEGGAWDPKGVMESSRNFLTKVWNLTRLILSALPDAMDPPRKAPPLGPESPVPDRWLLSRWTRLVGEVTGALDGAEFTAAAGRLHQFLWHDMADWYAEAMKEAWAGKEGEPVRRESLATALFVLERSLRLLHPFVPHVTEELWHSLPHDGESLAAAAWPRPEEGREDPVAEGQMAALQDMVRGLRTLRADAAIPPTHRPPAYVRARTPETAEVLNQEALRRIMERLSRSLSIRPIREGDLVPSQTLRLVTPGSEIFVEALPETDAEELRALDREYDRVAALLSKARERLAQGSFRARAPPQVIREYEEKEKELQERLDLLERHRKLGKEVAGDPPGSPPSGGSP